MPVSPEASAVVLGLGVCGAAVATVAGFAGPALPLAGAAAALLLAVPATAAVRAWLLDVSLDRGDTATAIAVAARARAAALLPRTRARAAVDLALAHLAAAEPAAAVPLLGEALPVLPDDERPPALALLAVALAHAGERERSAALAREALAADPDEALAAYALGLALLAGDDPAAALPLLLRGAAGEDADLVPSPGERAFALYRAHLALGDGTAARAALERAARARPSGPFARRAARLAAG